MTNPGWIHEKAVAMIQTALYGGYVNSVRKLGVGSCKVYARLRPGEDEFSGNIAEGAVKVKVPGEWDSVGGIVPDLILYGADDAPVRIIEVIDTSAPDKTKREKLNRIASRGVDVVEIEVHTEADLLHLFKHAPPLGFASNRAYIVGPGRSAQHAYDDRRADDYNNRADELLQVLAYCTPYQRQRLATALAELGSLDSLFPTPKPPKPG